jgi:hypothetical protein
VNSIKITLYGKKLPSLPQWSTAFCSPSTAIAAIAAIKFEPCYTAKNAQVDAILMKTGLDNVLLPTLFIAVNNIEQYCYTRFRLDNIVQYCWQVWTMWAAKHCSVLLSNGLGVFCRVDYLSLQQLWYYFLNCVYPNPPCQLSLWEETGAPGENPRLSAERWQPLFTWVRSENQTHELRGESRFLWRLRHRSQTCLPWKLRP